MDNLISYTLDQDSIEKLRTHSLSEDILEKLGKLMTENFLKGKKYLTDVQFRELLEKHELRPEQQVITECAIPALNHPIYAEEDFTFYLNRSVPNDPVESVLAYYQQADASPSGKQYSYDCRLRLRDLEPESEDHEIASGRVLACQCYEGEYWSLTFRKETKKVGTKRYSCSKPDRKQDQYKPKEERGKFLNTLSEICACLAEFVFGQDKSKAEWQGIVIVSGRTASAKSQIVRGLIHHYLNNCVVKPSRLDGRPEFVKGRLPHLVTYEDPIETYFAENWWEAESMGISYTPRQKKKDANLLKDVFQDALRQTPAVMFIGETREPRDWDRLVRFAGTGHLVFTTAHAGSLTEAMGNLLRATKSLQPEERSFVADRLLAVAHVKADQVGQIKILIPALWRHTQMGAKTLMSEGLSSLLPNTLGNTAKPELQSSIGRQWFASRLIDSHFGLKPDDARAIRKKAIEWDLEGV